MNATHPTSARFPASEPALERAGVNSRCHRTANVIARIALALLVTAVSFLLLPWELAAGISILVILAASLCRWNCERSTAVRTHSLSPLLFAPNPAPTVHIIPPPAARQTITYIPVANPRPRERVGDGHLNAPLLQRVPSAPPPFHTERPVSRSSFFFREPVRPPSSAHRPPPVAAPSHAGRHVPGDGHERNIRSAAPSRPGASVLREPVGTRNPR